MKGAKICAVSLFVLVIVLVLIKWVTEYVGSRSTYAGVYVRFAHHEYGTEWDTLEIAAQRKGQFHITRKWKYERTLDGRRLKAEYKKKVSTGTALPKEGVLLEEGSGLRYRVHENVLRRGQGAYHKIK